MLSHGRGTPVRQLGPLIPSLNWSLISAIPQQVSPFAEGCEGFVSDVDHNSVALSLESPLRVCPYRGTSLTTKRTPLGPYRGPMPRFLGGSQEGGRFLMGEVPFDGMARRMKWRESGQQGESTTGTPPPPLQGYLAHKKRPAP